MTIATDTNLCSTLFVTYCSEPNDVASETFQIVSIGACSHMTLRGSHDSVSGYEVTKTTNRQKNLAKVAAEYMKAPECYLLCVLKNFQKTQ